MKGESELQRVERYVREAEAHVARYKEMVAEGGDHARAQSAKLLREAEENLEAFRRELTRLQTRRTRRMDDVADEN